MDLISYKNFRDVSTWRKTRGSFEARVKFQIFLQTAALLSSDCKFAKTRYNAMIIAIVLRREDECPLLRTVEAAVVCLLWDLICLEAAVEIKRRSSIFLK